MPYPFDQIFAADPSNPENVASNGVVTIFAPGDPERAPLAITTLDGLPLPNPLQVNNAGFGPAFMHDTLDQVAWAGGGFSGLFVSYRGMKEEAVAARQAAQESAQIAADAASSAITPTAEAIQYAITTEGTAARQAVEAVAVVAAASKLDRAEADNTFAVKPDNGAKAVGKGELVLNVLDNGATGDGTTDDASRFSSAVASAQTFGASVYVPGRRTYYLSTAVQLRSNVRIWSDGAVLKKRGGASSDRVFEALSNGAKGYGSSVENVIIEGFIFEGSFAAGDTRGASITLHHARNVEIRNNIFRECISNGHAVDLGGCDDIRIHDNTFAGFNVQVGREYVEAIQLDHSMHGGVSGDAPASYDALPTINVTVENNRFVPLVKGGVTYPAPNPLGSHGRIIGRWFENIKFLNNYVQDGINTSIITDAFSVSIRGWLHFFCARNVEVSGNTFKVTDGRAAQVFGAHAITTGLPAADAASQAPVNVTMPALMPLIDLEFTNNTFIGFEGAAVEPLVRVTGNSLSGTRYAAANLAFTGNRTRGCYPTPGTPADIGTRLFDIRIADNVTVGAGFIRDIASLGAFTNVSGVSIVGADIKSVWWVLAQFDGCKQVSVKDQKVSGYAGGFWFRNCVGVDASDNQFEGGATVAGNNFAAPILINGCSQWKANGNIAPADSNDFLRGVNVYGASTKGMAKDNILVGYATPVTDTSTAKDTVISGTIN